MNTTLLVLDDDKKWRELDLYEDLPINVIIQETDITDITSRRSPYSKTFSIPGTSINNDFFEHFYEVNGVGFDPLTKRECVVQYRGTDIFKGYLRLNSIQLDKTSIEYEVYILSEVTDFASIIAEKELKKLDWNNYNHNQNYDTVTLSWFANSGTTQGLFNGDILYPMIHYGLEYLTSTGTTSQFQFAINTTGNTGFDYSGSSVNPTYFKPSIRVKAVLDKIFQDSGYQIVSDFFDSAYFRSIYMDLAANGKIGAETASGKTNQNIFRVYGNALPEGQKFNISDGSIQQIDFGRISTTDGYDPTLNFNETFGVYQVPASGLYSFEFRAKVNQFFNNNTVPTYWGLTIFKSSTIAGLSNPATRTAVGGTADNLVALNYNNVNNQRIFLNNISLGSGDYIGLFIRFNTSGSNNSAGLWVGPYEWSALNYGARWELYNSPTFISSNLVDMKLQIPDTSCLDFFKAIVKMFNLVVVQTPNEKELRIEPFNWYYSANYATKLDWTNKLDINTPYVLEPVNYQLQKAWNLQYETADEEYLGKLWEEQYVIPYGTKQFRALGDILQGEQTMEFPFRPLPTNVITGSTNIIIPMVYDLDTATGKQVAYSQKNHIFFWCGNRFMYGQSGYTQPTSWWLTSGATPIEWTTYPCVSHLSSLDVQDPDKVSDLNFDKSFDFFGNSNPGLQQFTEYNLYQTWWGDYFTNLYSPEVRRFTGRFVFNPIEIGQLDFRDRIFIKDSYFLIERVSEADLVDWKSTEVSLLKEVVPYNKIEPPAPNHSIYPNQPIPASGSIYTLSAYVTTDQFAICNTTLTGQTIYASTPTIADFSIVYVDNVGTPYPLGYYIQETSATTVFSTVNYFGLVLQNDC